MQWIQRPKGETDWVSALHEAFNQDPTKPLELAVSKLLVSRGIKRYDEALAFFNPAKTALHDPFLMRDMAKAVDRIEAALTAGQRILVFGDYDVDGTTAVALMYSYLASRGAEVAYYIPDRYLEGYGLSKKGIDFASDNGFSLLIALDCGVKSVDEVAYANSLGVDLIICDHHTPGALLPEAVAILDPKRPDCPYPFKELCGCGVGFKLVQALEQSKQSGLDTILHLTDLVAVAIGADVVSVMGENRTLATLGLTALQTYKRPGFVALLGKENLNELSLTDLNFSLAPKINAAGRMKHGAYAVSLMLTDTFEHASEEAKAIEAFNLERRATDQLVSEEALVLVESLGENDRYTTVVYQPHWHKGVIGIVASRLMSTYYRPTLVFTKSGDVLAASARSVQQYDIYAAIEACSEHLIQFGGHAYAAGLSVLEEQYEAFKVAFESHVRQTISETQLVPKIYYDFELDNTHLNTRFHRILKRFEPFGPDN
ncbi:MAG: single-stranded-DNA-specific exonuclease RecJ, partial [Bacteroidetes bacterium]|nr:single-stranded-DNA-specific exonuclease RecJ [Bacteroidota bacterium]